MRNSSRWPYPAYQQGYSLAVVLEVEPESAPPIYADLHAQFEVLAEIEIAAEAEGEAEIG